MAYQAPIKDLSFVIRELAGLEAVAALPGCEDATPDLVDSVLAEAGRFAAEVLAPLAVVGDSEGSRWAHGEVTTPKGFAAAYRQYVEGGWNGLTGSPEYGGMGLPTLIGAATHEIWNAANTSFALCPLLTASAVSLLERHGDDLQKRRYLARMVSGEWTATMDLTEPQAGSDLGAVRTRAKAQDDGSYRVFGQKIFISWGEHDVAENIIHLVLARADGAPGGSRGISLFLVPKFLVEDDGALGARNDMRCASIEHKLGIHASPTCTMAYGDADGAVAYLVGEENRGLEYMFTMMNAARHKVGIQGLAVAEAAFQAARDYAGERIQGKPPGAEAGAAIDHHPDVRRMLLTMKTQTEAMRALACVTGAAMDVAARGHGEAEALAQARVDFLIPIVKGWCTELGVEVASLGIQVHGGMGYIEETGAARYLRDARIFPIYEGTNGIQAGDLLGRKLVRDEGRAAAALVADMRATLADLEAVGQQPLTQIQASLAEAVAAFEQANKSLLELAAEEPAAAQAVAFDYMMLAGFTVGGWLMARAALVAQQALDGGSDDAGFYHAKLASARFYMAQVLPRAFAHARMVAGGGRAVVDYAAGAL